MKRIDRYVLVAFLIRLFGVAGVFLFLYLSYDILTRVDHLRNVGFGRAAGTLLAYYGYLTPTLLMDTIPDLLLLATGLTLVEMSRARELLILKAGGVNVRRVAAPIFIVVLLAVIVTSWARERVMPEFTRKHRVLDLMLDEKVSYTLQLREPAYNRKLLIQSFDHRMGTMGLVSIYEFYEPEPPETIAYRLRSRVRADAGSWTGEGRITLETVVVEEYTRDGKTKGDAVRLAVKLLETSLTPFDFAHSRDAEAGMRLPALTFEDLSEQSRRNPEVPWFRVKLHDRLAAPLVPFVLLLLGIPLLIGFEASVRSRMLGMGLCIIVAAGFHAVSFMLVSVASKGALSPPLAAWLPIIVAGGAGLWLFGRMHS